MQHKPAAAPKNPSVTGIVVAGGDSRRLTFDKRRLRLWGPNGPNLLERTVQVLQPLCAEVIVVLNDADEWPDLPARVATDMHTNGGALGGLYAGLAAARCPYALAVAADMPLLNGALLQAMLDYPRTYQALVPLLPFSKKPRQQVPQPVQPLHAIYSTACTQPIGALLNHGLRRMINMLDTLQVTYFDQSEIIRYDPAGYSFLNINTPHDLEKVQSLLHSAPSWTD